jgi:two-component system LytT family response regulator
VLVHVGRQAHAMREPLQRLASRLDPRRFPRIERGAIVNLDRIRELRPAFHGDLDVVLTTGERLRATRTYASALQERLRQG